LYENHIHFRLIIEEIVLSWEKKMHCLLKFIFLLIVSATAVHADCGNGWPSWSDKDKIADLIDKGWDPIEVTLSGATVTKYFDVVDLASRKRDKYQAEIENGIKFGKKQPITLEPKGLLEENICKYDLKMHGMRFFKLHIARVDDMQDAREFDPNEKMKNAIKSFSIGFGDALGSIAKASAPIITEVVVRVAAEVAIGAIQIALDDSDGLDSAFDDEASILAESASDALSALIEASGSLFGNE
jgi:hypothetical protein